MRTQRKRRLYFILFLMVGVSLAVGFALFALRQNINLYLTPAELLLRSIDRHKVVRLGGMVVKGSVHHELKSLKVTFVLTDFHRKIKVEYEGILPSLFRDGQGVVAQGVLQSNGVFKADQVLAKHDANYHPPNILNPDKART